jgi:hypothetical protein
MEQVYRISPAINRFYETALYTHKEGKWPNEEYYTTNKPTYVGKFIEHKQYGYGDGAIHVGIFLNDRNRQYVIVQYTYEGTTCFREVYPKILPVGMKEELFTKTNHVKSLATLAIYQLPLSIEYDKKMREYYIIQNALHNTQNKTTKDEKSMLSSRESSERSRVL